MIIQNNNISIPVSDESGLIVSQTASSPARDAGKVPAEAREAVFDRSPRPDRGESGVYTEAEARQSDEGLLELPPSGEMSPADFISQCMTGEDAMDLSGEETPLEEYTSSQLERAVSRVREQRSEKKEAVEGRTEKERDRQKQLEERDRQSTEKEAVLREVQDQLAQSGLPLTEENQKALVHAADLARQGQDITAAGMKFFVSSRIPVTPETIGAGVADRVEQAPSDGTFDALEEKVEEILTEGGVAVTEKSMEQARWLYEENLPVTADNVKLLQQLEELKVLSPSDLLARIADGMADGMKAEKTDLTKWSAKEADGAVRELLATDDEVLARTFKTEADVIRARCQLEEIRLSMTAEAARAMSAKGIQLDIRNLTQIVEELKDQERQARESLLRETNLPITQENEDIMTDSLRAAKTVLAAPAELVGRAPQIWETASLSELAETGHALQEQYDRAAQTYEAVGTQVRGDLGDSIRKAFGNIDDILEDLGLETTGANERAVRILGYNRMELTRENIEQIKFYDNKVNALMENLKPQVVARLIKENINPLSVSLDELDEQVNIIREETATEDISFRKFLWKMDHRGDISPEERESMVGIYRLLDKIEKSDGAVVGQVLKEGRELSFSSLLSATRTKRAEGMDVSVDDEFGGLEAAVARGTSISDQIQAAYNTSLAGQLQRKLSPKVLKEKGEAILEMSPEALLEACENDGEFQAEESRYYEHLAEEVRGALRDFGEDIRPFLEALEMPDTLENILAARGYLSGGRRGVSELWNREESDSVYR